MHVYDLVHVFARNNAWRWWMECTKAIASLREHKPMSHKPLHSFNPLQRSHCDSESFICTVGSLLQPLSSFSSTWSSLLISSGEVCQSTLHTQTDLWTILVGRASQYSLTHSYWPYLGMNGPRSHTHTCTEQNSSRPRKPHQNEQQNKINGSHG